MYLIDGDSAYLSTFEKLMPRSTVFPRVDKMLCHPQH